MIVQGVRFACRASGRGCRQAFRGGDGRSFQCKHQRSVASKASSVPDIKDLAKRAQIAVSDAEAAEWQPKINSIIDWFGQLQQVDVSGLPPSIHAIDHGTPLRVDEAKLHPARAELLAMAPALEKGFVRFPKIGTGADVGEATAAAAPGAEAPAAAKPAAAGAAAPAAATAGADEPPSASEVETFQSLDLRVGRIISCEKHPEADSLYVEKIDVGEAEPRTIVSGLVKYVPIEQMQDRLVVVICNLKARNMRGVKSFGMVLAASNEEHTLVEPLSPPAGATIGDRVFAGDAKEQAAPATANVVDKKKLWEVVQPHLKTGADRAVAWKGVPLKVEAGPLSSPTLSGARVS